MSSQQLTVREGYNLQAKLSTDLMFGAIGKNAELLKGQLPNGRTVIEVAAKTEENGGRVYRVATIYLQNSVPAIGKGKLQVNVSVHKYEEVMNTPTSAPTLPASSAKTNTTTLSKQQKSSSPQYFDLLPEQELENLAFNANECCERAFKVVELLKQHVFPKGIPLPANAKAIENYLIVMVEPDTIGSQQLEWITVRNFIPLQDGRLRSDRPDGFMSSVGSGWGQKDGQYNILGPTQYPGTDPNPDCDATDLFLHAPEGENLSVTAFTRFEQMIEVAKGKALPSSIPLNAVGTSASTSLLLQDASKTKKTKEIEEVKT